jgi:hypothetical protein
MTVAFAGTGIQTGQTPKDLYNETAGPAVGGNNDTVSLPRARLNDAPSRDQLARGYLQVIKTLSLAERHTRPPPSYSKERHGHLFNQAGRSRTYFLSDLSGT